MAYDDSIPQAERAAQNAKDDRAKVQQELQDRMTRIEDRYPLMFDGESVWGVAALYAVACLELDMEAQPAVWPVPRQVQQLQLIRQALEQLETQLTDPQCPKDGTPLTTQTRTVLGVASFCPTCGKAVL